MPEKDLFNITSILAVALIYSTTIWRMAICNGRSFQKLIKQLRENERNIFEHKNEDLHNIYCEHAKKNYVCSGFIWIGAVTVFLYYIRPVMEEMSSLPKYINVTIYNITTQYRIRPLPLSSWFPFNRYKYYYVCYVYHIIAAMIGGSMVVSTDLFFIALMIFIVGQLKILQYNLRNGPKLAKALKENVEINYEEALNCTIQYCVQQHQAIIKFSSGIAQVDRFLDYVYKECCCDDGIRFMDETPGVLQDSFRTIICKFFHLSRCINIAYGSIAVGIRPFQRLSTEIFKWFQ